MSRNQTIVVKMTHKSQSVLTEALLNQIGPCRHNSHSGGRPGAGLI